MRFNDILLKLVLLVPSCASAFITYGNHVSSCTVSSNTIVTSSFSGRGNIVNSGESTTQLWMDYDSMSMAELTRLSHQKGYETSGKDRVELIMICKGRPDLVNARPLSSVPPSTPIQRISTYEDFDTMNEEELRQIANGKGFQTYQLDRTSLIMIAKGYGDTIGAKRLNENTWQSEIAARSLSGNGIYLSGSVSPPPALSSSNELSSVYDPSPAQPAGNTGLPWKSQQNTQWSSESAATSNPFESPINAATAISTVKNGLPTLIMKASTRTSPSNGMPYSATQTPDNMGIESEEAKLPTIQQYYDFLTKLDSLRVPDIDQLVAEYEACNIEDKEKVKKGIMDLYQQEINMHSKRLNDLHNVINHIK